MRLWANKRVRMDSNKQITKGFTCSFDPNRQRNLSIIVTGHHDPLGRNNGVLTAETSHQERVAAITGASENSVSRRAARKIEEIREEY